MPLATQAAPKQLHQCLVVLRVLKGCNKPDIATNPDLEGQVGVTCDKENTKEEDAYNAHYVGSRVARLTL